jgi:hypothetical protein
MHRFKRACFRASNVTSWNESLEKLPQLEMSEAGSARTLRPQTWEGDGQFAISAHIGGRQLLHRPGTFDSDKLIIICMHEVRFMPAVSRSRDFSGGCFQEKKRMVMVLVQRVE